MKLQSDLIPHEKFHKGIWLKTNKCPWFFFYETPRKYNLPSDYKFYQTVDDDLKTLVKFLHSKNIPTTPSCSGHVQDEKHYGKIFDSLNNTTQDIKSQGINLSNPESGRKFFYKNPKYSLPFSREEFIDELKDYQKKGVLGFVDKVGLYEKLSNKIPVINDEGITLVLTKGKDSDTISKNWKAIERIIRNSI